VNRDASVVMPPGCHEFSRRVNREPVNREPAVTCVTAFCLLHEIRKKQDAPECHEVHETVNREPVNRRLHV